MLTLTILYAALASGLPLFSESFAQGQPGAETCAPFDNFLDSISPVTGAFGSVVFAGSAGDELVCSSAAAVDSIASSLSQRLDFAVTCGEQTWTGKTCASTTKFATGTQADHVCVLVREWFAFLRSFLIRVVVVRRPMLCIALGTTITVNSVSAVLLRVAASVDRPRQRSRR